MKKYLKALKVKDGWYVELITTHQENNYTDLLMFIKQQGLSIRTHLKPEKTSKKGSLGKKVRSENPNEIIFAD